MMKDLDKSVEVRQKSARHEGGPSINPLALGECMCAPASAAMKIIALGKRRLSRLRSVALDLFRQTNDPLTGAARRMELMGRLVNYYGMTTCSEIVPSSSSSLLNHIKRELRRGAFLLLRSASLTTPGHYVSPTGFAGSQLFFDDPYGRNLGAINSYSRNSTDPASMVGCNVSYDVSLFSTNNRATSLISCQ